MFFNPVICIFVKFCFVFLYYINPQDLIFHSLSYYFLYRCVTSTILTLTLPYTKAVKGFKWLIKQFSSLYQIEKNLCHLSLCNTTNKLILIFVNCIFIKCSTEDENQGLVFKTNNMHQIKNCDTSLFSVNLPLFFPLLYIHFVYYSQKPQEISRKVI